jgi:signal transduction histidine kinase
MSVGEQESAALNVLKLRTEELTLKTEELKQTSTSLLISNNALKSEEEQLARLHAELFDSNHELASVNKQVSETNKKFARTNIRFAQVNEELSEANKELARVNKELALANEQINAHEQETKDFISIAAHEFRTPTQSILGYSELLQNMFKEEVQKEAIRGEDSNSSSSNNECKQHVTQNQKDMALDAIVRNAHRLERLAKDILDVTKIEGMRLTLHKECFSLNEMIRNAIADATSIQITEYTSNDNKNIKIKFESEEGRDNDIFIEADRTMIQQVILNLLRNAIKNVKEDGIITIMTQVSTQKKVEADARKKEGEGELAAVVKVKDNGSGIDTRILPRLFTKFATTSLEGVGLGLYISKRIVEAHDGRIWAENNSNGKGSTFAFVLPCLVN